MLVLVRSIIVAETKRQEATIQTKNRQTILFALSHESVFCCSRHDGVARPLQFLPFAAISHSPLLDSQLPMRLPHPSVTTTYCICRNHIRNRIEKLRCDNISIEYTYIQYTPCRYRSRGASTLRLVGKSIRWVRKWRSMSMHWPTWKQGATHSRENSRTCTGPSKTRRKIAGRTSRIVTSCTTYVTFDV